jgi:hypothetical protein
MFLEFFVAISGFVTDNFSLLSITVDCGPFGFMKAYNQVCMIFMYVFYVCCILKITGLFYFFLLFNLFLHILIVITEHLYRKLKSPSMACDSVKPKYQNSL